MANLIKWAGQTVSLTIANKAKDNTGISYVKGVATFDASVNNGGTYTYGLFTADKVNSVSNSNAGSTSASVAVFTTKTMEELPAYYSGNVTFKPRFNVKWTNDDLTHNITTSYIDIHYPATELKSNIPSACYIYSNGSRSCIVWAHNNKGLTNDTHDAKNGAYAQNTASITITGCESYTDTKKGINAISNTKFNISFNKTVSIGGCCRVTFTSTSNAGVATDSKNAALTALSRTDYIYLMNATKQISVNGSTADSSFYVVKGQTKSMEFDIIPYNPGTAYSYAVTLAQTPATAASHTLTAASAGKKGSISIQGLAVGTTKLQLKSTATATDGGVVSPVVTIYVSSNVTEIYINCGDRYSWPLASADVTFSNSNDACISVAKSGTTLVVTAKQLAVNTTDAVSVIKLNTGATLTVHVAHLSLTLS